MYSPEVNKLGKLDSFENPSCLRINISQTKAVWVGSIRFSKERICTDLNLDWVHEFTALGITYDI